MNTLSSLLEFIGDIIGAAPSNLVTSSKTLVGAINEAVGAAPSTLTTTSKTLVGAINEVDSDIEDVESSLKTLVLTKTGVSSLSNCVFSDSRITADHVCPPGNAYLSNPSAQTDEWTVTTAAGTATVTGSISGTTDITLYLELKA